MAHLYGIAGATAERNVGVPAVAPSRDTELAAQLAARFGICVGKDMHGQSYVGRPGTKDVILFYDEGGNPPAAELSAVIRAVASLSNTLGALTSDEAQAHEARWYRFLRDAAHPDTNGGLRCVGNCADGGAPLHISGHDLDRAVDAACDRVDPTACPECIGMGCDACNGTGDADGVDVIFQAGAELEEMRQHGNTDDATEAAAHLESVRQGPSRG